MPSGLVLCKYLFERSTRSKPDLVAIWSFVIGTFIFPPMLSLEDASDSCESVAPTDVCSTYVGITIINFDEHLPDFDPKVNMI